jgi:hypothetical protein
MNVEDVIAALDTRFDPDEAAIASRILREHAGTIPDPWLIGEIGLAIAMHRRQRQDEIGPR